MSIGGIAGTVVGGAIGYIIGGPAGMMIGAGIGMAAGMVVDPVEPDVAKPDPAQLAAPTAVEGVPVAEALGTVQLSGGFIWYCCPRSEEEKERAGGKGGGKKVVTGYRYYLSFAVGLCRGPADVLYCIYVSIHAPARGATKSSGSPDSSSEFQSTPPHGGRLLLYNFLNFQLLFGYCRDLDSFGSFAYQIVKELCSN